jgi:phage portal protein BeeE
MPNRRRRRSAFAAQAEPQAYTVKGANDPSSVLDAIAVGNTKLPAFDVYWYLYQKHPTVAACVNLIANTVSGDGFDVMAVDGKKDAVAVAKSPEAQEINDFFDSCWVGKMTFRRAMFALAVDLRVFGLGYWRKRRAGKLVIGLERLDPRCVIPRPSDDRTEIKTFLVRTQKDENDLNSIVGAPLFQNADEVSPNDIVFFTLGGGDQLLGAPSPLEHLDTTIGLDLAIRRFRQSFFNNGAVNGKIIGIKGGTRDDGRALEAQINNTKKGPENAYKTWVLTGPDFVIDDKGNSSGESDVDFVKGTEINRDEVFMVYHVPPGKILFSGSALGSSGKAEDDSTFQEQCVLPLEEAIYEIVNRDLLVAEFGIKDLELAPKRRSALRFDMFGAASQGVQIGMTGNESRALVNLAPITDPKYDMDSPLFMQVHGQSVAAEEPLADQESAPAQGDGVVDDSNDAIDDKDVADGKQPGVKKKKPGGGQSSANPKAKGFRRWY